MNIWTKPSQSYHLYTNTVLHVMTSLTHYRGVLSERTKSHDIDVPTPNSLHPQLTITISEKGAPTVFVVG